jgi:hypothetical protein
MAKMHAKRHYAVAFYDYYFYLYHIYVSEVIILIVISSKFTTEFYCKREEWSFKHVVVNSVSLPSSPYAPKYVSLCVTARTGNR